MYMENEDHLRMDKYLWYVRIFKSRALASEACKKGRILIDGIPLKPSRLVKYGDIINVKKSPLVYTYFVKDFPKSRVSPKIVHNYVEDRTSSKELIKLKIQETFFIRRDKGSGRPTKKERRDFDKVREQ